MRRGRRSAPYSVRMHMESTSRASVLGRIEWAMKIIAAVCLVAMAMVTGVDVVGRGGLNTPLFGTEEIVTVLAVLVAGFALPYAHSQGSHIGVEVLYSKLGGTGRMVLDVFSHTVSGALFGVVAWRMWLYGASLQEYGEVSMNLALPLCYVVYALAFCFLVFSLCLLASALNAVARRNR